MSRSRANKRTRPPRADNLTKAPRGAAPRAPQGGREISDLVQYITSASLNGPGRDRDATGRTLPVPAEWIANPFGPGKPITFEPLDGPRPDGSGRPQPRIYEYPRQWNIFGTTRADRPVPWRVLEEAADAPLFRACIEIRKTELSSLEWVIRPAKTAVDRISKHSRRGAQDVAQELREKYRDEIDRETEFWEYPDRRNGYSFADWIALALEEQLVYDAITVYPQRTYGGQLRDFLIIDSSTIKPLLDEQGGRPLPPYPAYQQILFGFPRGEFVADTETLTDGRVIMPGGYNSDQLVYRRRVLRPKSPYGFPPVEQALLDGLLYNQRFRWMLSEYTEGTIPAGWIENDGSNEWEPRQVLEYERLFNDRYAGQTSERFREAVLPPGLHPVIPPQVAERYKAEYDLHLIRLVAMHFGLTITELGFMDKGGLGSVGYHEGQEDVQFRKQRLPDIRWISSFVTELAVKHRGMSRDLEFTFLALDDEDEESEDQVWQNRVASGRATLNEDRARLGMPSYEFAEADMPQLQTARGVVFLQDASKAALPGVLIEPASEHPDSDGSPVSPTQRRPLSPVTPDAAKSVDWALVDMEIATCRRWLAKGNHARKFRFEHVDLDIAAHRCEDLLMEDRVEFAKAGGAGPKDASSDPSNSTGQDGSSISPSPRDMRQSSPPLLVLHSPYQPL